MTIYNTSFALEQVSLKMTFTFGLVVIGNIVDNVSQPKWVALFLQVALGFCWIIIGVVVWYIESDQLTFGKDISAYFLNNLMIAQFLGSGVVIINIL